MCFDSASNPDTFGLDVLTVVEPLGDDHVQQRVEKRDVGAGAELEHVGGVALQGLAPGVHHDEGRLLCRLLEEGGGDGVVLGGVGADHDDDVGVLARGERGGHCPRADAFEERNDRRGVAQPRTVVDVVGAEALADHLLDEVGLLVRALGGAEAGERRSAVAVADRCEPARGAVQRLLPARLAKMGEGIRGIDLTVGRLRRVVSPDERRGEAMGMGHVVEAEPTLHAQTVVVGGAVAALHRGYHSTFGPTLGRTLGVVLDLIGDLAADPAIGAHALHLVELEPAVDAGLVDQRRLHQRAGRARLDAFSAGDAGARAHLIVEVENDLRADATVGHADDVVDLHLAARTHAEIAMDAGVEVDPHRGVARVGSDRGAAREAALGDVQALGPLPQPGVVLVRDLAWRLVGHQHLHHHAARGFRPLGGGVHHQAGCRPALARCREHPLALDLHHARTAVAVGPVAGLVRVAQMRDVGAETMRDLPDRLCVERLDLASVEGESNRFIHWRISGDLTLSLQSVAKS